ncbi:sulfate ABC transporter ATP-binding protein, partial [Bradyrhizobium sp. 35]|nr:sulfate ABC transporter ATP-binding protein [Bradyrhizobium sp. 35]
PVKLYARPWQLQFAEANEAHLTGTVRSSYRTQGRQRIEVDRPGAKVVVVEAADTARLAAGREVGLRIVGGHVFP